MTQIITALSEISGRYNAMFVDLWGCLHNGVTAYPEAVAAMQDYRKAGGVVVLVTNAPRARSGVERQLVKFGSPEDAWDTIATSGDSARMAMFRGAVGRKVYFVGQDHALKFFEPLKIIEDPVDGTSVPLAEAEGIVCCGPFDPSADLRPCPPPAGRTWPRLLERPNPRRGRWRPYRHCRRHGRGSRQPVHRRRSCGRGHQDNAPARAGGAKGLSRHGKSVAHLHHRAAALTNHPLIFCTREVIKLPDRA